MSPAYPTRLYSMMMGNEGWPAERMSAITHPPRANNIPSAMSRLPLRLSLRQSRCTVTGISPNPHFGQTR